jgi:hypothetical protein
LASSPESCENRHNFRSWLQDWNCAEEVLELLA